MKTMEIFEPAMCCSTGLCGVSIDQELLRVTTVLRNLQANNIEVKRYNLSANPMQFVQNTAVHAELQTSGNTTLPLILVNGEIVLKKRYPTNEEFCTFLEIPNSFLQANGDSFCTQNKNINQTNYCSKENKS